MIRFILIRHVKDANNGMECSSYFTLDADVPELEKALSQGGMGENGYDVVEFVNVELREQPAQEL